MAAPFAILSTLSNIDTPSAIQVEPVETFSHRSGVPSELIGAMENPNDELHKAYNKLLLIKQDISNIKWNIFLLEIDIIHRRRNKRKKQILKYIIERRERLLSPIELSKYNVGSPIKPKSIVGRIAIHDVSQCNSGKFSLGCLCKKNDKKKHEEINHETTLSISTRSWQMLFYNKAIFVQDKKGFVVVPYEKIKIFHDNIYNEGLSRTYGYNVVRTSWYHSRIDGGPDRRFKENFQIYTIHRHQATLHIEGFPKPIYLLFETHNDYDVIANVIKKCCSQKYQKE